MPLLDKPIVMVVDSRPEPRRLVTAAFQTGDARLQVISAESGRAALERLAGGPIQILVAPTELSDMSGLKLIQEVRRAAPRTNVMALVESDDESSRIRFAVAGVPFLDRGRQIGELLSWARSVCFGEHLGIESEITGMSLVQALVRLCKRRTTAQLRVVRNGNLGAVVIEKGELVHAQTESAQGEKAVHEMVGWKSPALELMHILKSDKKTIFRPWMDVLAELPAGSGIVLDRRAGTKAPGPTGRPLSLLGRPKAGPLRPAPGMRKIERAAEVARVQAARRRRSGAAVVLAGLVGILIGTVLYLAFDMELLSPGVARFIGLAPYEESAQALSALQAAERAQARPVETMAVPAAPVARPQEGIPEGGWRRCGVSVAWLPEFAHSANLVMVSEDLFRELGLATDPSVELRNARGVQIGAVAVSHPAAQPGMVCLRESIAQALDLDPRGGSPLFIRPAEPSGPPMPVSEVSFRYARELPSQYCESWFAVGVSYKVLAEYGLSVGSYAITRGPNGFQSVRIQLMDRGEPDEIWLSESVRQAIGVASAKDRVTLYPKSRWLQ